MEGATTYLTTKEAEQPPRPFVFDHSFWSHNPSDKHFVTQEKVFNTLGAEVLDDAFDGFNCCIFAYGQTGSGKSYTMMGSGGEDRGLIPRLCEGLFQRIEDANSGGGDVWTSKIEVSYMELYLERVKDLLNPATASTSKTLKVREHKTTGPYVEDLTSHAVANFSMINELLDHGDKLRTVRATSMNDVSSRSHAIFQLVGARLLSGAAAPFCFGTG